MKNYLVAKNYTITDHTKWYDDRSNETSLVENYGEMEKILVETARKHLLKLDDIIVHRGKAAHIRDVFKLHFKEIYDLWKSEKCNILYTDLDVVFLQDATFFGAYDFFAMFNFTDPVSTVDEHYGLTFEKFFNCGVRYYPHNMDEKIWDLGFEMLENWNPDRWDAEQVIYNNMLWSQNIEPQLFYRPDLAFQMLNGNPLHQQNTDFNRISVRNAAVVHVHGSRGSGNRLQIMQELTEGNFSEEVLLL
jgi:hypothetical protein